VVLAKEFGEAAGGGERAAFTAALQVCRPGLFRETNEVSNNYFAGAASLPLRQDDLQGLLGLAADGAVAVVDVRAGGVRRGPCWHSALSCSVPIGTRRINENGVRKNDSADLV
jgi:hypothetical protein